MEFNVFRPQAGSSHYLEKVHSHLPLVQEFRPDLVVWYCGFNSHRNDYGSMGLMETDCLAVCDLLVSLAGEMGVPLQVVLGGGTLHQVATATIPGIIQRLADD